MRARRPMTPADIRRQVVLDEHDMAADGSLAVVSKRIIRRDRYESHLVVVPLGLDRPPGERSSSSAPRPITTGPVRDAWPRISPDARHVAFLRSLTNDEDEPTHLCLVPIAGGRVRRVRATGFGSVSEVAWSPEGTRLAFTAEVDPPRFLVGHVPALGRKAPPTRRDRSPLARRITRSDWRWDGIGHLDRWSHLFVMDAAPGARPRQVTSGDWGVSDIAWSADGRTIAYTSPSGPDPDIDPRTTIWAVDLDAAAPSHGRSSLRWAGRVTRRSHPTVPGSWRSGSTRRSRSTTSARASSWDRSMGLRHR